MAKKTLVDPRSGKRRHLTRWQQEVQKHGIKGAKKAYAGYKQGPAPANTTGNVRNVKGGTRRVKDTKVGRGKRTILRYKGDKVGTWTSSGGNTTKGRSGLSWYMERGYGTAKKPVPKTKLTERLGIAGKGKMSAETFEASRNPNMLVPGATAGLNQEEEWEMRRHGRRAIREAEQILSAEEFNAQALTMWQRAVQKHGVPPAPRAKKHGHPAFKAYRGRKQRDGVMYHHGDKTSKWDKKTGKYSTKGVNTGRGWYMERGYGTARKPVPDTPTARKAGLAGAGKQTRDARGRFGKFKRMLVPGKGDFGFGINSKQDWETKGKTRDGGRVLAERAEKPFVRKPIREMKVKRVMKPTARKEMPRPALSRRDRGYMAFAEDQQ